MNEAELKFDEQEIEKVETGEFDNKNVFTCCRLLMSSHCFYQFSANDVRTIIA